MADSNFVAMLKKTVNPGKIRESLIDNEELSDVTFLLGPEQAAEELHAHKFFLITSSPVLHDILAHSPVPNNNNEVAQLRIKEISKETMIEVCRYAYSDTVNFKQTNMLDILNAAINLQMKFLVERAIDYISREGLNENTVFEIVQINEKLNNTKLSLKCFEYIKKNHPKCFKTPAFPGISSETFKLLIENCDLSKKAAQNAIESWSKASPGNMLAIDELVALISINCTADESIIQVSDDDSDATSVADSVVSRAQSYAGEQRNDNRQRRGSGRNNGNNGPRAANMSNGNMNPLQQKLMQLQNNILLKCGGNPKNINFSMIGDMEIRWCKFSNLDFDTKCSLMIHEIHFNYDIRQTDREFKLTIYDVTTNHKKEQVYYNEINTDQQRGEYTSHVLTRPCRIDGPKNLWISIVFSAETKRPSFSKNMTCHPNEFMTLRGPGSSTKSGQIISNVIFRLN